MELPLDWDENVKSEESMAPAWRETKVKLFFIINMVLLRDLANLTLEYAELTAFVLHTTSQFFEIPWTFAQQSTTVMKQMMFMEMWEKKIPYQSATIEKLLQLVFSKNLCEFLPTKLDLDDLVNAVHHLDFRSVPLPFPAYDLRGRFQLKHHDSWHCSDCKETMSSCRVSISTGRTCHVCGQETRVRCGWTASCQMCGCRLHIDHLRQ